MPALRARLHHRPLSVLGMNPHAGHLRGGQALPGSTGLRHSLPGTPGPPSGLAFPRCRSVRCLKSGRVSGFGLFEVTVPGFHRAIPSGARLHAPYCVTGMHSLRSIPELTRRACGLLPPGLALIAGGTALEHFGASPGRWTFFGATIGTLGAGAIALAAVLIGAALQYVRSRRVLEGRSIAFCK